MTAVQANSVNSTRATKRAALVAAATLALLASAGSGAAASGDAEQNAPAVKWLFTWDGAVVAGWGGAANGTSYDNLFRAGVTADGAALGLSVASHFAATFACAKNGPSISNDLGDIQGVINLDADSRCRPYTLSAGEDFGGGASADIGLIPADLDFDAADSAGVLLNSSFGVQPTWSRNTIAPIYPTAGIGATVAWQRAGWSDRAGVFQANPEKLDSVFDEGALFIDELAYDGTASGFGVFKLGVWDYRPQSGSSGALPPANWGLYVFTEQPLPTRDASGATAFLRLGLSPNAVSTVRLDLEAGALVRSPLPDRPTDELSVGVALVELHGGLTETAFEATYVLSVSEHIFLQPDVQYVLSPAGTLPPAKLAALRVHVAFE